MSRELRARARPARTHGPSSERLSRRSSCASARALLDRYHRHGDLEAREQLIQQYLPLVRRLARRHAGRGEHVEDLVQVGSIGLINAIDRFELDRGVDLSSYAIPSIVGEIKRHLRDRVSAIRVPRRLQEVNALRRSRRWLAKPASTVTRLSRPSSPSNRPSRCHSPRMETETGRCRAPT
jgi:RNA polymerase sigma factor (sigma-70 family)